MRNLTTAIIFLGYFSVAHCQTFRGTVYDRSTDSTLSFAIVYISGTSIGTYSDINGNFSLNISRYSSMPITISMLGYYSYTLPEHSSNKIYNIYLTPKIKELNEVIVTAKGHWKTYLRVFRREFLGENENALDCDILNEDDIHFSYNSDSSTLRAFSSKPILIKNKALGYTITYYLDKFKYSRKTDEMHVLTETFIMLGNYIFNDDLPAFSESERRKAEGRRREAYPGSRMHFFRLLYQGNLAQNGKYNLLLSDNNQDSNGFSIGSKKVLKSDSFVIRKDTVSACFRNGGELNVRFRTRYSRLVLKEDSVCFEKNGYFDPVEISFSGDMSQQRIGDLLPFEYQLNQ
jgi:hypothetical protein